MFQAASALGLAMNNFFASVIGGLIPAKVKTFLSGKKTYVVAILAAGTAAAQALGYNVPDWVYILEGAAGLGAVRVAISKSGGAYNTGALQLPPDPSKPSVTLTNS